MQIVTRQEEQQLYNHCTEVGVLLDEDVLDDTKLPKEHLPKLRAALRAAKRGSDGRLHPTYGRGITGRIQSRAPLENYDWGCLTAPEGHSILELCVWSTEPLFLAHIAKQMDLFRALVHDRKNIGDALQEKLQLTTKHDRQIAKAAFFHTAYTMRGTNPVSMDGPNLDDETVEMMKRIIAAYPRLEQPTERLRPWLQCAHRNEAAFWLGIAHAAQKIEGLRLVGFWHQEPLIECPSEKVEEVTEVLVAQGDIALRAMC